jgi:D-lactate dehydrogenase
MRLAVFSTKSYDKLYLSRTLTTSYPSLSDITYHSFALSIDTVSLASDSDVVCIFVNDKVDAAVLKCLHSYGVRALLLRCAGFNNVDLVTAEELGFFVANVPSYSPEAVAEFAVGLIQTVNRKTHRAYNRVREGNFNLEGLMGRNLYGKTVGIVGVGRIGMALARIMRGFGCQLLAYDLYESEEFKALGTFVELDVLLRQSDVISLHCPLTEKTRHIINSDTLGMIKNGALIVNTSRGGLIDTKAAIEALKANQLGGLALDVYEAEGELFYNDHSDEIIQDDELMRLMTFPNVLVCGHQAFFTKEAMSEIADCTLKNLEDFVTGKSCKNSLVKEGNVLARRDTEPVRL